MGELIRSSAHNLTPFLVKALCHTVVEWSAEVPSTDVSVGALCCKVNLATDQLTTLSTGLLWAILSGGLIWSPYTAWQMLLARGIVTRWLNGLLEYPLFFCQQMFLLKPCCRMLCFGQVDWSNLRGPPQMFYLGPACRKFCFND
jgi:hypothetical protein